MAFMCNSCFSLMDRGEIAGGPCILTSCFHILCNACSHRIHNNECVTCKKQCKVVTIGKDMPQALASLFEPPLTKVEKIQQQLRFLHQQQEMNSKLQKAVEERQRKKAQRIQKILDMEQQHKAEEQRLMKRIKEKVQLYKNMKEKYDKLTDEEQRLRKFFEENGYQVDNKDLSTDSGMHSFEKSTSSRFEH